MDFSSLGHKERILVTVYTLFHLQGADTAMARSIVESLTGQPLIDFKATLAHIKSLGFFAEKGYNWRTDSYDYDIADEYQIPCMIYCYEEDPQLTIKVLEASRDLKPSHVQKLLWQFISSGYENIRIEEISDYEIGEQLKVFIPAVCDKRFAILLSVFSATNFSDLIKLRFEEIFREEQSVDIAYIRQRIRSYKVFRETPEHQLERKNDMDGDIMQQRLLCLCDLYDYLANGNKPSNLISGYAEHHVIAAIYEAYHTNYRVSLEHFKKAVTIGSKSNGFLTNTKPYLPYAIENFMYAIVAYKVGNDDGRKKALTISKCAEPHVTMAAKVLCNILFGGATEKQVRERLNILYSNGGVDKVLATIMCQYIGKEFSENAHPQWYITKKENSAESGSLLYTIYHKQDWESVLEDLSGITSIDQQNEQKKEQRIGYFMSDIKKNTVIVRQQQTLKNGGWGAGKMMSTATFLSLHAEGMTDADRRIAEATKNAEESEVSLLRVLPEMSHESRLYVGRYTPFTLVDVTEEVPYITMHHDSNGFLITSNVTASEVEAFTDVQNADVIIITYRGASSINFIRLTQQQRPYYRRLLSIDRFPNEAEPQLRRFLKNIGGVIEVNSDLIEGGSTLPMTEGSSSLIIQMRPDTRVRGGEPFYNVACFVRPLAGGRIRCVPGDGNEVIIDTGIAGGGEGREGKESRESRESREGKESKEGKEGKESYIRTRVQRDLKKERENLDHLIDALYEELPDISEVIREGGDSIPAYELLPLLEYAQNNPDHVSCEWPEGSRLNIKHRNTSVAWNGMIKKNDNGWFEIEGSVELNQGKVVSMAQLLDLVSQAKGRFITLGGGDFMAISDKLRKQLEILSTIASRSRGALQMSPFSAALLGPEVLDGEMTFTEDEELKEIRRRIKDSSTYSPEVPATLTATLRGYQKEGYQWMARLNKWGAGALLADDMGLGKTIQTIAFLLAKAHEGPALIVAPASVAPNWNVEFGKFAPSLNIIMLNFEENRDEAIRTAKAGDVIVCTYMLLLSVKDTITEKKWNTICLDEAHIIKNRGAKTSAVAMKLKSENRIMLTGTPVQNHLGELWNLFQFVNPGLLGSFEDFNRRFIVPIEQNHSKSIQHQLDRLVKPFMLRRTKDKVAQELPDKEEIYQHVDMNEEEQLTYEAMRQQAEAMLLSYVGRNSLPGVFGEKQGFRAAGGQGRGVVNVNTLAEITRLRLCACCGSKVTALIEKLQTIIEGGGSTLVFSQFTTYLATIRQSLDEVRIPYLYIDGTVSIKERALLVEKFQAGECPVFLISLKAGGLGLNLTRANYVIHMDPWWNPAIENQATDRAHRIGQKRAVTVYHLISEGTIEEKIQRLHERKRTLVENILEATDSSYKLTGEELLEMVQAHP